VSVLSDIAEAGGAPFTFRSDIDGECNSKAMDEGHMNVARSWTSAALANPTQTTPGSKASMAVFANSA